MARATLRALVLGMAASGLLAPDLVRAEGALQLLGPTPLIMRDERLVEVTVHAVPFEPGEAAMTEDGIESLAELGEVLATDCFLNAQAVGHAEPALADGPEPMAAHRIARSRAERVRAALMAHGLPEGSIAAFWDWQLAVREASVTLWVFQLRRGADCVGRRLQPIPEVVALVPQAPPESPPEAEAPVTAAVDEPEAPPPAPPAPSAMAEPEVPPPAIEALQAPEPDPSVVPEPPPVPEPASVPEPPPVEELALDPPAAEPDLPLTAAEPPPSAPPAAAVVPSAPAAAPPPPEQLVAAEPPQVDFPFTTVVARLRPQPPAAPEMIEGQALPGAAAAAPDALPEPEAAQPAPPLAAAPPPAPVEPEAVAIDPTVLTTAVPDGGAPAGPADVEIVFDLNSSYLPRAAVPQLRQLVERMPRDRGWKVVLTASVSAAEERIPDQAAAQRYNRWLAERRLGRVADWLEQNSEVRDLQLVRSFAAADASRRVTVAVAPAS